MVMKNNLLGIVVTLALLSMVLGVDIGSNQEKKIMKSIAPIVGGSRNGKLFFVSTTTSTLSTTTACFYSGTNTLTTCTGKRKRSISASPDTEDDVRQKISPKRIERDIESVQEQEGAVENSPLAGEPSDVESGLKDVDNERDAKFLLYWATSTTTSTTYSSTSTIATVECTPSGYTVSVCG